MSEEGVSATLDADAARQCDAADRAVRHLWSLSGRQPWLVVFRDPVEETLGVRARPSWRKQLLKLVLWTQPVGFRHIVLLTPMGETPGGERLWLRIDPLSTGVHIGAVMDAGLIEEFRSGRVLIVPERKSLNDPRFWGGICCSTVAAAILKHPFNGAWITPATLFSRLVAEGAIRLNCEEAPNRGSSRSRFYNAGE